MRWISTSCLLNINQCFSHPLTNPRHLRYMFPLAHYCLLTHSFIFPLTTFSIQSHASISSQRAPLSFLFTFFLFLFFFYIYIYIQYKTVSPLSQEEESLENYSLVDSLFLLPPTQWVKQAKHLRLLLLEKNSSAIISTSDFRHLEFGKAHLYLLQFQRRDEHSGKFHWQH